MVQLSIPTEVAASNHFEPSFSNIHGQASNVGLTERHFQNAFKGFDIASICCYASSTRDITGVGNNEETCTFARITFASVAHADNAFAALQFCRIPGVEPPVFLQMSREPDSAMVNCVAIPEFGSMRMGESKRIELFTGRSAYVNSSSSSNLPDKVWLGERLHEVHAEIQELKTLRQAELHGDGSLQVMLERATFDVRESRSTMEALREEIQDMKMSRKGDSTQILEKLASVNDTQQEDTVEEDLGELKRLAQQLVSMNILHIQETRTSNVIMGQLAKDMGALRRADNLTEEIAAIKLANAQDMAAQQLKLEEQEKVIAALRVRVAHSEVALEELHADLSASQSEINVLCAKLSESEDTVESLHAQLTTSHQQREDDATVHQADIESHKALKDSAINEKLEWRSRFQQTQADCVGLLQDSHVWRKKCCTAWAERRNVEKELDSAKQELTELQEEMNWKQATKEERERCLVRDEEMLGSKPWNKKRAVKRIVALLDEFEKLEFSKEQPLTSRSIPWPVLKDPTEFSFRNLDDNKVDRFLTFAEEFLDKKEFKKLLQRMKLAFNPDVWRSSRILDTVINESTRRLLEKAGKAISTSLNEFQRGSSRSN